MGIRESLEEAQLKEQGPGNLKDFAMPEEEKQEIRFDAREEFSEEQIQEIKDWIISKRLNLLEDHQDVSDLDVSYNVFDLDVSVIAASNFKNLFPNDFIELDSVLDDGYWSIFADIEGTEKSTNPPSLVEYLYALKNIFPDRFSSSRFESEEYKRLLDRRCHDRLDNYKAAFFSGSSTLDFKKNILLFFPEDHLPDDNLGYKPASKNIADVLNFYANLRLVYPKKYVEMSKGLDFRRILVEYRKQKLELEKEKRYFPLLFMTLEMQIIFAKEAKITENGLEIIMPEKKSFQPEKHKRPERRNF